MGYIVFSLVLLASFKGFRFFFHFFLILCFVVDHFFWRFSVYWNCLPSPAPENNLLQLWNAMNGMQIQSGSILPQVVHDTLSTPSAIFYVSEIFKLDQFWVGSFNCTGSVILGDFNMLQVKSCQCIEDCMIIGSFCSLRN
jgi:hypothetical protein